MSHSVILQGHDASLRWWIAEGTRVLDHGVVQTIGALPRSVIEQDTLTLILPGERAATRQIKLPVRGERALNDAASLAFEDILSAPVDQYHFGFGALNEAGMRMVSAVPRQWFVGQIQPFLERGVEPDLITLDHLALSAPGQDAVILYEQDRVVAQLLDGGFSGAINFMTPITDLMQLPKNTLKAGISPYSPLAEGVTLGLSDDRSFGQFLLKGIANLRPINFRVGAFAKRRNWQSLASLWRHAVLLMAACLAFWLADMGLDGVRHARAAATLNDQSEAVFTTAFPAIPIRDLRRQAQQRIGGSAGSEFLPLSAALAQAMKDSVAIELRGIRFTQEGELVADLRFPDAAALERLIGTLDQMGINTREGGNLRREENGDFAGQLFLGAV